MPRYFIDLHTGTEHVRDHEGFDLPDMDAVRRKLVRIMTTIVKDLSPDLDREDYVAAVRDETGAFVLRSRLTLTMEATE
ncbi:DUF6894 family protein [Methylobacterium haplocladii]|uniref:DUF6894 domain-containing protein n=1 Tax=Methylobacterium haplocladii TaxID=1176176 RepID=A0A512IJP5_9HYPH|nr:hypothetical protein [Methylobacterium haplocladii]GEO97914.1 hypothetical protein MHA02_03020 [Methylobacterium haplocladii]GJD84851.1 hypothetical protein HPGCJGGD_2734 [Methylobacterium haplocladii]GLS58679.1 hypothetical protein GCM10007887_13430 [Methylobacterium haplocladii]